MVIDSCVAGAVAASSQAGVLLSAVRGSRPEQSSEERRPSEGSLPVQRPAHGNQHTSLRNPSSQIPYGEESRKGDLWSCPGDRTSPLEELLFTSCNFESLCAEMKAFIV